MWFNVRCMLKFVVHYVLIVRVTAEMVPTTHLLVVRCDAY